MKVFIKQVKSAIGRDGLDDGVCVFEKVIDHRITLEDIEEEDDNEVVSSLSKKMPTFKSTLYIVYFIASERKLGIEVTVTLKLSLIDLKKQNLLL